ncbi:MAG TPA: hypothetical protein PLX41_05850 [Bacteroidales bacterium]|jgi:hypothetical protein|nr:hypothetical protein [Bacteroidales bacterium]
MVFSEGICSSVLIRVCLLTPLKWQAEKDTEPEQLHLVGSFYPDADNYSSA